MDLCLLLLFFPHWCVLMLTFIINYLKPCCRHSVGHVVRQGHTAELWIYYGSIRQQARLQGRAGQVGSAGTRGCTDSVPRGLGSLAGVSVCARHCHAHGSSPPSAAALMVATFSALQTQFCAAPSSWRSSILTKQADKRKNQDFSYKAGSEGSPGPLLVVCSCSMQEHSGQVPDPPVPPCPTAGEQLKVAMCSTSTAQ